MDVVIAFILGLMVGCSCGMIAACMIMSTKDDTLES